ncbi:MAG: hypothetical protein AAF512_20750 [Pseudomonadota bacterium]
MKRMKIWQACFVVGVIGLSGCWNQGNNSNIKLGDVSLGEQLIDLKRALEAEALTPQEYEAAKQSLLTLNALCENTAPGQEANASGG